MLEVGETAPEFALPDQHGRVVHRSDFDGDPLVVYFYPRAGTEGCTTEARAFDALAERFAEHDTSVVGISDDPVSDLTGFARSEDLSLPLLSDETGEVSTLYDSYGEKQLYGTVFDGVFRHTYLLDGGGTVAAAYPDVTPGEHARTVLEDVVALRSRRAAGD